jgi:hypothetical protein
MVAVSTVEASTDLPLSMVGLLIAAIFTAWRATGFGRHLPPLLLAHKIKDPN